MNQRIIYINDNDLVSVVAPDPQVSDRFGIDAIAAKDVPPGVAFKIVNVEDFPPDRDDWRDWAGNLGL